MLAIIGAILAIGLLIVVHEAGHYFVARWCKMRVERFSLGFGPPILKWRRGETDFTLGPIPFGGFVQISGMNLTEDVDPEDTRAYPNRPVWQRFLAIFAGPAANYLFAVVIGVFYFSAYGVIGSTSYWEISGVEKGFGADGVLQPGDRITAVEGEPFYARHPNKSYPNLIEVIGNRKDKPVALTIERDGKPQTVMLTAKLDEQYFDGSLWQGIASDLPRYRIGVALDQSRADVGIGEAVTTAFRQPVEQSIPILAGLYHMVTSWQRVEADGPVGITSRIKQQIDHGWRQTLFFLMSLNVYLGLFNLLPLPALDGGRLVFLGYEMVTRRRANPKIEAVVHMVGIMALLVIFVIVTYGDIVERITN